MGLINFYGCCHVLKRETEDSNPKCLTYFTDFALHPTDESTWYMSSIERPDKFLALKILPQDIRCNREKLAM